MSCAVKDYIEVEAHLIKSESLVEGIFERESQRKFKPQWIVTIMDAKFLKQLLKFYFSICS